MRYFFFFVSFFTYFSFICCRDFYMGMFSRDDYLVAQDNVYKEKRPYTRVVAEYGRLFKCPISYFRVVDRLGRGPGPVVKILKGGLQKHYIAIRLRSAYNMPVSVNIYVGCQNKEPRKIIRPTKSAATTGAGDLTTKGSEQGISSTEGTVTSGSGDDSVSKAVSSGISSTTTSTTTTEGPV